MQGRDGRDGRDGAPGPSGLDGLKEMSGNTGPRGPPGPVSEGVTYVRWGRTTCPDTQGTELVYRGTVAGSLWSSSGGGSNYQCITENPDFGPGTVEASQIYGTEYEVYGNVPTSALPLVQNNAPCSVCYIATRETILMIPGPDVTNTCYVDGVGVTECSCFQIQVGETDCHGRYGATQIRIRDNDRKKYSLSTFYNF